MSSTVKIPHARDSSREPTPEVDECPADADASSGLVDHHGEVMRLLEANRGVPLTKKTMDTYATYLTDPHISSTALEPLLEDLASRSDSDSDVALVEACIIIKTLGLPAFWREFSERARSHNIYTEPRSQLRVQRWTAELISRLALRESMLSAILDTIDAAPYPRFHLYRAPQEERDTSSNICARLVSILQTATDTNAQCVAALALSRLSCSANGARAVVGANALEHVPALLHQSDSAWGHASRSSVADPVVKAHTLQMLKNMMAHRTSPLYPRTAPVEQSGSPPESELDPCRQVICILSSDNLQSPVNAVALKCIEHLLHDRDLAVRQWTVRKLADELSDSSRTRYALQSLRIHGRLESLLR
ncbi:hypothetical protein B0H13DRAFT_2014740 [Mycena leptocephala]|nr:hypothetical protein B0H13DRAFT_2014740 [Mycena leptocephala]